MGSLSDYLELELLDHCFVNGAYSPPETVWLGLSTADPTDDGSGLAEPSGNGYARKAITFAAAASRAIVQNADVTFDQATGSWGTIPHYAVFDAENSGNMLAHGALSTSKEVVSGNTPKVASGEVTITFSTGAIFDYLAHKLLDFAFRNQAFSQPATWLALSTTIPTDAGGSITEPSGGSYARHQVTAWDAAAAGATENTNEESFAQATASWGTIVYMCIFDAETVGNELWRGDVTDQAVGDGDTVKFPAGDIDVTLD